MPSNNQFINKPNQTRNLIIQRCSSNKMYLIKIKKITNSQDFSTNDPGWTIKTGKRPPSP